MMITISSREKQLRSQQQQAGIVSIIVATMLIIIVSLIVIAFAQVSRREQRESLDAQLSTQAYYAADTGVNAVNSVIQTLLATPALLTKQPNCTPDSTSWMYNAVDYNIDSGNNVAITCLTVDPAPTSLSYQLHADSATVVPVKPDGGVGIFSLTFSWPKNAGINQSIARCQSKLNGGAYDLPSDDIWNNGWQCPYAAIRTDLVNADGGLTRANLLNGDQVSFLLPVDNRFVPASSNLNGVSAATCTEDTCSVTFTNLGHNSMYLRLISLYRGEETVTITGTDNTFAHAPLKFTGAQAKIDATGRAQDVLRRIVVSAPLLKTDNASPAQALVSGDSVCKRFSVFTGYYQPDPAYTGPAYGCN